ncbi:hypothetical protein DDZ14_16245 [Maritimibacter sp. 55A14]|uniref:AAA family ATPase n=1 Tax=Maritimibacter sp. 55A14 TaxID=2174844 RepID=UPI000D620C44|nr:AAA family ATPase [Maritimibacter sp. 55A14]PWE29990.1 hypothetical protein DDZ14_16245 [Maritimibacter sp. 55A14]
MTEKEQSAKVVEDTHKWTPPALTPDLDSAALENWRVQTERLRKIAKAEGLTMSGVSKSSGVPVGTLSPWYSASYKGKYENITERVKRWLDSHDESRRALTGMPAAPEFVETPTARRLIEALIYAQTLPEFSVVTTGSGLGKTETARHYVATRPHAYLVTMRPSTSGRHSMLQELAMALDVSESNPARLDRAIGQKLLRNGRHTLLILDEAQNLVDDAVNQLRYFNDEFGCGIALFGNEAVYRRWGSASGGRDKDGYAQVHSRIGLRILQRVPMAGDVEAILDAWKITDPEIRKLATAISRKPGALRQVDRALKLANMVAIGAGTAMTADHLKQAWANRGGEELRS